RRRQRLVVRGLNGRNGFCWLGRRSWNGGRSRNGIGILRMGDESGVVYGIERREERGREVGSLEDELVCKDTGIDLLALLERLVVIPRTIVVLFVVHGLSGARNSSSAVRVARFSVRSAARRPPAGLRP